MLDASEWSFCLLPSLQLLGYPAIIPPSTPTSAASQVCAGDHTAEPSADGNPVLEYGM